MQGRKTQVSAGGLRPKITPAEIFLPDLRLPPKADILNFRYQAVPNQGAGRPRVTWIPLNCEYSSKP